MALADGSANVRIPCTEAKPNALYVEREVFDHGVAVAALRTKLWLGTMQRVDGL